MSFMSGEKSTVLIGRQDICSDGLVYRSCSNVKNTAMYWFTTQTFGIRIFGNKLQVVLMQVVSAPTNSFRNLQAEGPIAKRRGDSWRFLLESLFYFPRELHLAMMCWKCKKRQKVPRTDMTVVFYSLSVTSNDQSSSSFSLIWACHMILPNVVLEATVFIWPE